jgi:hypothetical protein
MTEMPDYNPEIGTFGDYVSTEPAVSSHPVLVVLNEKIEKLEKDLAEKEGYRVSMADQLRSVRYDHDSKKLKLKDVLAELLEEEEINFENATKIAEIFDVMLTKRIDIEYNITASVTIEVPMNADPDDVADNLYCDRVDFSTYNSDHEVLETDFDVSDWNVRS